MGEETCSCCSGMINYLKIPFGKDFYCWECFFKNEQERIEIKKERELAEISSN